MTNIVEERQRNRRLFLQKIYELPDMNDSNRVLGAKAIDTVDSNPVLKSQIINGLKAGSFAALEKMIDHPVAKFFVEGAK